jgi:hypothetical protein
MRTIMLATLAILSGSVYAGPSKWVDEQGRVHYSDNPPKHNAKVQQLQFKDTVATPQPADDLYAPRSTAEMEADLKRGKDTRAAQEKKDEQVRAQTEAKQINCANARANLASMQQHGRMFKTDASGERVYMDDNQRQQQIDAAQSRVNEYCN